MNLHLESTPKTPPPSQPESLNSQPEEQETQEAAELPDTGSIASSDEAAGGDEPPSHFDGLIDDAPDTLPVHHDGGYNEAMLDKEAFHALFCGSFEVGSLMTGLKSLHVDKGDGKAVAASAALYDTILDVPMLHFMLKPQGKWMARVMAMGMFGFSMSQAVKAELSERQRAAGKANPAAQGAGEGKQEEGIPDYEFK